MRAKQFTPELHGEDGHLNVYVRDHDSVVTGYGQHARVVAFSPESVTAYCRVDYRHEGLHRPTDQQIIEVMRAQEGLSGKWHVHLRRSWGKPKWDSEDVYLRKD